jgi:hypothetical protein
MTGAVQCLFKGTVHRKTHFEKSFIRMGQQIFIFKFKGNLILKLQKNRFQWLKQKLWLSHFNRTPLLQKTDSRKPIS